MAAWRSTMGIVVFEVDDTLSGYNEKHIDNINQLKGMIKRLPQKKDVSFRIDMGRYINEKLDPIELKRGQTRLQLLHCYSAFCSAAMQDISDTNSAVRRLQAAADLGLRIVPVPPGAARVASVSDGSFVADRETGARQRPARRCQGSRARRAMPLGLRLCLLAPLADDAGGKNIGSLETGVSQSADLCHLLVLAHSLEVADYVSEEYFPGLHLLDVGQGEVRVYKDCQRPKEGASPIAVRADWETMSAARRAFE
ncbi:unnamed protein product, partial [Prorocentrum cordatum]